MPTANAKELGMEWCRYPRNCRDEKVRRSIRTAKFKGKVGQDECLVADLNVVLAGFNPSERRDWRGINEPCWDLRELG